MKIALPTLLLSLAFAGGCQSRDNGYASPDDPHRASRKVPAIENTYMMVGLGKPPLSFLVKTGGWLKVVDATDNTIVLTAQILPDSMAFGTMIRVDEQLKAITITPGRDASVVSEPSAAVEAARPMAVQPIQPDHWFEIYYQK